MELKQFKETHGHCRVLQSTELGKWVSKQRSGLRKKDNAQNRERIRRLNRIGFIWNATDTKSPWYTRFYELVEFKHKKGHLNISQESNLGKWIIEQRVSKRKGTLNQDRIQKLEAIGFQWTLIKSH